MNSADGDGSFCSAMGDESFYSSTSGVNNNSIISKLGNISASDALVLLDENDIMLQEGTVIAEYDSDEVDNYFLEERPFAECPVKPRKQERSTAAPYKHLYHIPNLRVISNESSAGHEGGIGNSEKLKNKIEMIVVAGFSVQEYASALVSKGFVSDTDVSSDEEEDLAASSSFYAATPEKNDESFDSQKTILQPQDCPEDAMNFGDEKVAVVYQIQSPPLPRPNLTLDGEEVEEPVAEIIKKITEECDRFMEVVEEEDLSDAVKAIQDVADLKPSTAEETQSPQEKIKDLEKKLDEQDVQECQILEAPNMSELKILPAAEMEGKTIGTLEQILESDSDEAESVVNAMNITKFIDELTQEALKEVKVMNSGDEDQVFAKPSGECDERRFWEENMIIKMSVYKEFVAKTAELKSLMEKCSDNELAEKKRMLLKLEALIHTVDEPPNETSRTFCLGVAEKSEKVKRCPYSREDIVELRRAYSEAVQPFITYDKRTLMELGDSTLSKRRPSLDLEKANRVLK